MAQVANCPKCRHEILILDDTAADSWARCPACRVYFKVGEVIPVREIKTGQTLFQLPQEDAVETATVGETMLDTAEDRGRRTVSDASQLTIHEQPPESADENAVLDEGTPAGDAGQFAGPLAAESDAPATAQEPIVKPFGFDRFGTFIGDAPVDFAERPAADLTNSLADTASTRPPEALDDSADRIDKWFRTTKQTVESIAPGAESPEPVVSSNTALPDKALPDKAPLESCAIESPLSDDVDPTPPAKFEADDRLQETPALEATDAIDDETSSPGQAPAEISAIEDTESPILDNSTDDLAAPPPLTIELDAAADTEERIDDEQSEVTDATESDSQATEPRESPVADSAPQVFIPPGRVPRRRKSTVRKLITAVVPAIVGLAIGYYVLMWISGPAGDFLNLARLLPSAVLPAEFESERASHGNEPALQTPGAERTVVDTPDETTGGTEVQAGYRSDPAIGAIGAPRNDDPANVAGDDQPTNPDGQPLVDVAAVPAIADDGHYAVDLLTNSPTFTVDDLAEAVRTAKRVQPQLIAGDIDDGRPVQQAKGYSYSLLSDLARKMLFVDMSSRADEISSLRADAEQLFQQTLSDAHTRDEVARILPK